MKSYPFLFASYLLLFSKVGLCTRGHFTLFIKGDFNYLKNKMQFLSW